MTHRIVSTGAGSTRPLVVAYLIHETLDPELRGALPGACILAYSDAAGEPLATTERRARDAGWPGGPVALVGYSAGVGQGIRRRLLDGAQPSAVIAIDGIHSSLPATSWQLQVWRDHIGHATLGRRLFVATCTQLDYVERLPAAERYQSSANTIRQITGWPLRDAGPLPLGAVSRLGEAYVHSYASGPVDKKAHEDQQTVALPAMLRTYLAPWLAKQVVPARSFTPEPVTLPTGMRNIKRGDSGPDVAAWQELLHDAGYDPGAVDGIFGPVTTEATTAFQRVAGLTPDGIVGPRTRSAATLARLSKRPAPAPASGLGAALLDRARADLLAGVREEWGHNDGARIREYFEGTGAPKGSAWCAAAVRRWLLDAATGIGARPPIHGSVSAKAIGKQLERAGRWIGAEELRANPEKMRIGMIVVWHRGAPGAATGHVGVVSRVDGRRFHSIEGNSGAASDRAAEMVHMLSEVHLLGAGWID